MSSERSRRRVFPASSILLEKRWQNQRYEEHQNKVPLLRNYYNVTILLLNISFYGFYVVATYNLIELNVNYEFCMNPTKFDATKKFTIFFEQNDHSSGPWKYRT